MGSRGRGSTFGQGIDAHRAFSLPPVSPWWAIALVCLGLLALRPRHGWGGGAQGAERAAPLDGRIELAWQPVSGAQGYRSTAARAPIRSPRPVGQTGATTFSDAQAQPGATYFYAVRPLSGGGEADPSRLVRITAASASCAADNRVVGENCLPGTATGGSGGSPGDRGLRDRPEHRSRAVRRLESRFAASRRHRDAAVRPLGGHRDADHDSQPKADGHRGAAGPAACAPAGTGCCLERRTRAGTRRRRARSPSRFAAEGGAIRCRRDGRAPRAIRAGDRRAGGPAG
jgi:hypothetical protein